MTFLKYSRKIDIKINKKRDMKNLKIVLASLLVGGLIGLSSCTKDEALTIVEQDVFLGTFESNGGCIPERTWDITITKFEGGDIYEFRCKTDTGFETRRYPLVSDEDDVFTISVTSPSTIFMSSDWVAFRCSTYLTKVN